MKHILEITALTLALTLCERGSALAQKEVMKVYVFGRTKEAPENSDNKALKKELEQKRSQAEKALKNLEKQLKKQHGKKFAEWPEESQNRRTSTTRPTTSPIGTGTWQQPTSY